MSAMRASPCSKRSGIALALIALAGCGVPHVTLDGAVPGDAATLGDLGSSVDAVAGVDALFTIIGCAQLNVTDGQITCQGPAPLTLTFVPLSSGVSTSTWTFAGGSPATSMALSPVVTYSSTGSYLVGLAGGGPGGTVAATGTVVVTAGATGAACSSDQDCDAATGLRCWCAGGVCPGALAAGFCTRSCASGAPPCDSGQLCVDLTRGLIAPMSDDEWTPPDGGASDGGAFGFDGGLRHGARDGGAYSTTDDGGAWRGVVCVPGCADANQCRTGLQCRALPTVTTGAASYGWSLGCFADLLGDVGASCTAASGALDPSACLSGRCDPLGARGVCTTGCSTTAACPTASGCVQLHDADSDALCLARCSATAPCTDPLLTCAAAGQTGELGFSIVSGASDATYCAPKPCTSANDCPGGRCQVAGAASFCHHL